MLEVSITLMVCFNPQKVAVKIMSVCRSGLIGSMGIPDVSVGGPRSKISGEQLVIDVTRYYRSFVSYVAVLYTIEHLAICG